MTKDQGFKVYYYHTHIDGFDAQVINNWVPDPKDLHGCIATDIRKWPEIPLVFIDLGKKVEALYGYGVPFRRDYFLDQVQTSKMDCNNPQTLPVNNRTNHNRYYGNILASNHDPPQEGEVVARRLEETCRQGG